MPIVSPTGPIYAGASDVDEPPLALGWDVEASAPYTLAVDGVSTTILTPDSTLEEIEAALNETSGPVGLDVDGDTSTSYSVSTDTPAKLTGNGANVTVTAVPPDPEEELPPGQLSEQKAINRAYQVLTRMDHRGPYEWPQSTVTTQGAIDALAPYQTVDPLTTEALAGAQGKTVKEPDDEDKPELIDWGQDPRAKGEFERQQEEHAKAQFDAYIEQRAAAQEAAEEARKAQEGLDEQDKAFRQGVQDELNRVELTAIQKQERLKVPHPGGPVGLPTPPFYVPKPSDPGGVNLSKVPGRSDRKPTQDLLDRVAPKGK